jgi:tyrosyl-tRNA synthetase
VKFLKIFTFLSLDEIDTIAKAFEAAPHERLAQKTLAKEVVTLVHGEAAYAQAVNISEQLFGSYQSLISQRHQSWLKRCA